MNKALLAALALAPAAASAQVRITFLHTAPRQARAGQDLEIVGNMFGAADVDRAYVHYRNAGDPNFKNVELSPDQGDIYRAVIPGRDITGATLEYWVEAVDFFGQSHEIFTSQDRPQRVAILGGAGGVAQAPQRTEVPLPPPPRSEPPRREAPPPRREEPPPRREEVPLPPPPRIAQERANEPPRPKPKPRPRPRETDVLTAEPPPGAGEEGGARPRARGALADELALYGAEDPVSVAAGHEQKVSEAPAIVSSVNEEAIRESGARTLADVLKLLPGFESSRDIQGFYHVAVRGIRNDAEVLLLYDGHRLNNPYDGKALYELPAQDIERVEVIRGPGSALYGGGAFLGVVNVVPKRKEGVQATAGGAWFDGDPGSADPPLEGEAHLVGGQKWGDLGVYADGSAVATNGYHRVISTDNLTGTLRGTNGPNGQPLLGKDAPAGYTDDKGRLLNLGLAAKYQLGQGSETGVDLRWLHEQRAALVGFFDTVGPGSVLGWDILLVGAHLAYKIGEDTLQLRLHYDTQSADRFFQLAPAGYPTGVANSYFQNGVFEDFAFSTTSLGGEVSYDRELFADNHLLASLQLARESLDSYADTTNVGTDSSGKPVDLGTMQAQQFPTGCQWQPPLQMCGLPQTFLQPRLLIGALLQDEWRVGPLGVTAGVRFDRYSQALLDTSALAKPQAAPPTTENVGMAFSPRLGLVWAAAEGLVLKGLVASAYRPPTFQELSDFVVPVMSFATGRFAGSSSLQPVKILTAEVGGEYAFTTAPAKIRLRTNGFYQRYSSPIVAVDTTGNNNQPFTNRSDQGVHIFGAEAEARAQFGARYSQFVNLSWFRATDEAAPDGFNYLTDVPQYKLTLGVVQGLGELFDLSGQVTLGAERRNDSRTVLESLRFWTIPAYAVVDGVLRTQPMALAGGQFTVGLILRNLLGYDYRDDVSRPDRIPGLVPGAPRSVYLEAALKY